VPTGATYSPITVTVNALTGYSSIPFILTFSQNNSVINANSFGPQTDFTAAGTELKISTADLDGDGKPDMIVNYVNGTPSFSIFRNTSTPGNVSYAARTDITAQTVFGSNLFVPITATADFDGDGKLDIVAAQNGNGNTIAVLKNTSTPGNISFANSITFNSGRVGYSSVFAADMDGDGKPDIVLECTNSNGIIVFRNTSSGGTISFDGGTTFAVRIDVNTVTNPYSMALADLNGDGKPDILVSGYNGGLLTNNYVYVLRNTSNAASLSFSSPDSIATLNGPQAIYTGDFDGDGKLDIALGYLNSINVSIFKNTTTSNTISFASAANFSTGGTNYIRGIAVGDLNGDGKVDLAVATAQTGNDVNVWLNTTSGGTIAFSTYSYAPNAQLYDIGICDADGDGMPDMVISGSNPVNAASVIRNVIGIPNITSFTPTSAGTDTTITITGTNFTGATGVTIGGVQATSFNVVNSTTITAVTGVNATGTNVSVTGPIGTGTLTGFIYLPPPTITSVSPTIIKQSQNVTITGTNFTGLEAVSFGGVPAQSFTLISSTSISAAPGIGASGSASITTTGGAAAFAGLTFIGPPVITSFSPLSGAAGSSVTITGAGFSTTPASNIVYFGGVRASVNAASATSLTVTVPTGVAYSPITVTVNLLTAYSPRPFILTFSSGTQAINPNSFVPEVNFPAGGGGTQVLTADFDGDGKPDMVENYNTSSSFFSVYRNTSTPGNVSYAARTDVTSQSILGSGTPINTAIADFNGDGKLDIAVVGGSSFAILKNTSTSGSISFANGQVITTLNGNSAVVAADMNGDGLPDLVLEYSGGIIIYLNTSSGGTISFDGGTTFSIGSGNNTGTNTSQRTLAVADLNGDGEPDILASNYADGTISVLQNTGTGGALSFTRSTVQTQASPPGYLHR